MTKLIWGDSPYTKVKLNIGILIVGIVFTIGGIIQLNSFYNADNVIFSKQTSIEGVVDTAFYDYSYDSNDRKHITGYKITLNESTTVFKVNNIFRHLYKELGNSIMPGNFIELSYLPKGKSNTAIIISLKGEKVFFSVDDYISNSKRHSTNGFWLVPFGILFICYGSIQIRKHFRNKRNHLLYDRN